MAMATSSSSSEQSGSTSSPSTILSRSENALGEKWDACLADATIKMGSGFALGAVFSLFLFKRRAWPMIFGTGTGFGMGYSNCQSELNKSFKRCKK